jgi:hypothetical protein
MSSRREQILAAITTTLEAVPGAVGVWRSRAEALMRDEAPAIVIAPARDQPAVPRVSTRFIDHSFTLEVAVNARGLIPDQLADPLLVAIHALLMADRSVGGLAVDVRPGATSWQLDKADLTSCWAVQQWTIDYRTSLAAIDA